MDELKIEIRRLKCPICHQYVQAISDLAYLKYNAHMIKEHTSTAVQYAKKYSLSEVEEILRLVVSYGYLKEDEAENFKKTLSGE